MQTSGEGKAEMEGKGEQNSEARWALQQVSHVLDCFGEIHPQKKAWQQISSVWTPQKMPASGKLTVKPAKLRISVSTGR